MEKLTKHQKASIIKVVLDNPEGDLPIMLNQVIELTEEYIIEINSKPKKSDNSSSKKDCYAVCPTCYLKGQIQKDCPDCKGTGKRSPS